jgi:hypothetical protein
VELKGERKKDTEVLEGKLRTAEIEKAEYSAKEQSARENVNVIRSEKEQAEREYQTQIQDQKKEFRRLVDEAKGEVSQHEQTAKDLNRRSMSLESDFDKQKALLEQKISFYLDSFE